MDATDTPTPDPRAPFRLHTRVATLRPEPWHIPKGPHAVVVTVAWDGSKLSIQGVEGPRKNGDAVGSCGQISMRADTHIERAPWYDQLADTWDRWHLNDMQAGSPRQEAFLRASPQRGFDEARAALTCAGLEPDAEYLHNGKPYRYGSAWLREKVPTDVLAFLRSLPPYHAMPLRWARG